MQSLENHFLIAMPNMQDPAFKHSVTYICEHNEQGAMGLVINQPIDLTVGELLDQIKIEKGKGYFGADKATLTGQDRDLIAYAKKHLGTDGRNLKDVQKQLESAKNQIGVRIDPNVTVDIHRIFRLPGSLNSKSGLAKILVNDIDKFNPYFDACLLDSDTTEVVANCPIQFSLKNKKFGPYNQETISVPKFAAVYMICKGVANHT